MKEYKKRSKCAICKNKKLQKILELGQVPLAGYFPKDDERHILSGYELNLNFCPKCGLVQTDSVINPDTLFKDYRYISSVGLQSHFNEVAKMLDDKYKVKDKDILDIGCNDGVLLAPLKELGAKCIGIDPAENIVQIARERELEVINDYFNKKKAKKYGFKNKFDIITSNNTFAHITNIRSVLKGVKYSLKEGGVFIIEVHYLKRLIEDIQWDNIYHEHIYYYSLTALNNFAELVGLKVIDYEEFPIHSGSIRVTMKKTHTLEKSTKVEARLKEESDMGLTSVEYFRNFSENMRKQINQIKKLLWVCDYNSKVIGFGASGRANMFCNIVKLTNNDVSYIIDESPERYGRFIANTDIPIFPMEKLDEIENKNEFYVLITAWNYQQKIIDKLTPKGFKKFIVAFPEPKIIDVE